MRNDNATDGSTASNATGHTDGRGLVTVRLRGEELRFAVDDPDDTVQRHLVRGRFYEADQLRDHARLVHRRSTVIDVGANVGNHSVFYARTRADRVYPFEPNPRANALLRRTVAANDLPAIDLTHADLGVADEPGELWVEQGRANNLGTAHLAAENGAGRTRVRVTPLDDVDFEGEISLLKIDVEGLEMRVLAGAERLIAEHRPAVAIEVDTANLAAFWAWTDVRSYHVMNAVRPYAANINYLCIPRY